MKHALILLLACACLWPIGSSASEYGCFTDSLAPRDEDGLLHQMPALDSTDLAPRYPMRFQYYFQPGDSLITRPAYVGALQNSLRRLGYYCGPTDGVFSADVSAAIARMQKNYSQRVTGTLTIGVRRALHLP